ncbi:MAG: DNA/RNA non-specific endonuclease [Proteobacteria bacterium]|nr:DNA/RNA non-specific endonuclease [Pseudomonadota bacterium]MDA0929597.1 DNA/RNA non-specific endonuclease [Pseudomonadota bacterium]
MKSQSPSFSSPCRGILLIVAALLVPNISIAQSMAITHCSGECPSYGSQLTANRSNVVIHHLYAAGVNGDTSLPDWVAYRLTKEAVGVASLLPRSWRPDRLVAFSPLEDIVTLGEAELNISESIAAANNPYGGGAAAMVEPENRARLAPMTSFANTPYWPDLNNFSNMVPMPAPLRLGPWLRLEQKLNSVAAAGDEVYVVAGPLYLISNLSLSPSSVELNPAAYFKLVADESGVAAFAFPHDLAQSGDYCKYRASLGDIEKMADITFFPDRKQQAESPALFKKLGCQ